MQTLFTLQVHRDNKTALMFWYVTRQPRLLHLLETVHDDHCTGDSVATTVQCGDFEYNTSSPSKYTKGLVLIFATKESGIVVC